MDIQYPRQPGSTTVVVEDDWIQDTPFGHCPACGSLAMEDIFISGDPVISFYCSDTTCRDKRGKRTMWGDDKTPELLEIEKRGGCWNREKFPDQDLPDFCPD